MLLRSSHVFICHLSISFGEVSASFAQFLIELFHFLIAKFWEFFIYSGYKSLLDISFASNVYPPIASFFILWRVSFTEHKFFILIKSNLSNLSFLDCVLVCIYKMPLSNPKPEKFSMFSSKSFTQLYIWF